MSGRIHHVELDSTREKLNKIHFVAFYPCVALASKSAKLPKNMKITRRMIAAIQMALSDQKMTQAALAKKLGYHRSHISKILKGEVDTISPDLIDGINDVLKLDLAPVVQSNGAASPLVLKLSRLAEEDSTLSALLENLAKVAAPPVGAFLPQVDTSKLPKIGAAITKIVMEWEQPKDPHYAKIAVEVLDLLRKFYEKEDAKS